MAVLFCSKVTYMLVSLVLSDTNKPFLLFVKFNVDMLNVVMTSVTKNKEFRLGNLT